MISVNEARDIIFSELFKPDIKVVDLHDGFNYFIAEDIAADRDYPPFNRAAVDGFALSSKDLDKGQKEFKIEAIIFSGDNSAYTYKPGECVKIMTGAVVPDGLDVIFKVEDCEFNPDYFKYTGQKYSPGMNVARRGENSARGEVIIRKGERIDYRTAHSLAATGRSRVPVFDVPQVAIISTGSEVVAIDSIPQPYQIRDSNYSGLSLALKKFNIIPEKYFLVNDSRKEISAAIEEGLKSDVLIISGGVSMGDADFVPKLLDEFGVNKKIHNVKVKPGKPFWYGTMGDKKVFALPGNPLSTLVSYKLFIEPWLELSLGSKAQDRLFLPVMESRTLKGNRPEYFPVKIVNVSNKSYLQSMDFQGSGDVTASIGSDGLAFHPLEKKEIGQGEYLEFILWN